MARRAAMAAKDSSGVAFARITSTRAASVGIASSTRTNETSVAIVDSRSASVLACERKVGSGDVCCPFETLKMEICPYLTH